MSNSIWKTPAEKPKSFSFILEHHKAYDFDNHKVITAYNIFETGGNPQNPFDENTIRWCHLDELLAQADKAERSQKAIEWLVGGDTGISSKTMCAALFGATPKKSDMPHDADDFGRCLRFIRFMPDGTKDIVFKKLSDKPEWVEIGNRWDELVELYDQENWRGIYDILSAIRKEHRKPRPNEIFIGL